jgi:CDP-diacylglycerol--glycerol-3-phosphate 3-phosphatidyltransferase
MFDGKFRAPVDAAVKPIGAALRKTKLTPDHLTVVGLVVGAAAAVAVGAGELRLGLSLVILAALPDLLDGALAKASNPASQRGAFFDSTIDRITDALLFGGILYYFATTEDPRLTLLPFAVSSLSAVISYQRAKAESLGLDAKGGLMERAERIVAICVGLLIEPWWNGALVWILWGMLVLIAITAVQRFLPDVRGRAQPPRLG